MHRVIFLAIFLTLLASLHFFNGSAQAEDAGALIDQLRAVKPQAGNAAELREAWEKVIKLGPKVLPRLLEAMDTPNVAAANWLRTAFDRIAEPALKNGNKGIDVDRILAFALDPRRQGRARRLALETVD